MVAAVAGRPILATGTIDTRSFRDEERAAIESLRSLPASVAELAARPGVDAHVAELLVYFLMLTKLAVIAAAAPEHAPVSVRPAVTAPGRGERFAKISISPSAQFEATGRSPAPVRVAAPPASVRGPGLPASVRSAVPPASVPPAAPPASVRPAGPLSPDQPKPVLAPLSFRSAAPPSQRAGVDAPSSSTASAPQPPPSVRAPSTAQPENPEAASAIDQAEMYFAIDERHQALGFVRQALALVPKMPAGLVLLAALEASTVHKGQEDKLRDILKRLDFVIATNPTCRRGRFYRGQIRRRLGDIEGAISDLQEAVRIDPDDVDAKRELKLCQMKERDSGGTQRKSLLDKLRGK